MITITGRSNDDIEITGGSPTPEVIVRAATSADAQAIDRLVRLACQQAGVEYTPIPEAFYPMQRQIFVAERNGTVVGLVALIPQDNDTMQIGHMFVETYRNIFIGSALIARAIEFHGFGIGKYQNMTHNSMVRQ